MGSIVRSGSTLTLHAPHNASTLDRNKDGVAVIKDAQGHDLAGATSEAVILCDPAVRACGDVVRMFDAARSVAPGFVRRLRGASSLVLEHHRQCYCSA